MAKTTRALLLLAVALLGAAQFAAARPLGRVLAKHRDQAQNRELSRTVPDANCTTVLELLEASGDFSVLLAAINVAGLDDVLSDPNLAATVFAPTDAAFAALLEDLKLNTTEQLLNNTGLVTKVLKYHIIPKPYTTTALVDGRKYPTLLTLDALASKKFLHRYQIDATKLTVDKIIRIKKFPPSRTIEVSIVPSGGPVAEIIVPNLKACKSYVQVVDEVLIPDLKPKKRKAQVAGVPSGIGGKVRIDGPVEQHK